MELGLMFNGNTPWLSIYHFKLFRKQVFVCLTGLMYSSLELVLRHKFKQYILKFFFTFSENNC